MTDKAHTDPGQDALSTRLEQANRQLLQSEKLAAIGQLAAGVAHEINNPVGYVYSNLQTLENYLNDLFRSEEHTSELQSRPHLVCRLLLEKKKKKLKKN